MLYRLFRQAGWYIGIALLFLFGITAVKYGKWIDQRFFPSQNQQQIAAPSPVSPSAGVKGQRALTEALSHLKETLQTVSTWQQDIEPLKDLTSEALTVDHKALIDKFAFLTNEQRATAAELQESVNRIEELQQKIETQAGQANATPLSQAELTEIENLHTQSLSAMQQWHRAVEYGMAIKFELEAAQADPPSTPQRTTVGDQLQQASAETRLAELSDHIEDQTAKRKAAEKRENERAAEEAELLQKATSPEVTAILAPFLESRNIQPRMSGAAVRFRTTPEQQPMSFSALQGMNALSPSIDGLKRLALLGGHRKLPAPRWAVHSQPGNWTDDDTAMLKQAQQMLRDLGPILVKTGKLSP